jgi:hypothetical protein
MEGKFYPSLDSVGAGFKIRAIRTIGTRYRIESVLRDGTKAILKQKLAIAAAGTNAVARTSQIEWLFAGTRIYGGYSCSRDNNR